MALEDIVRAIREDAKAEAVALRREGEAQARAIDERARQRARARTAVIAEEAERHAAAMRRALIRDVEHELKTARIAAERERLDGLFGELEERLARLRADPGEHRATTIRLLEEGLDALPEASVLRLDPRDRALVEPIVQGKALELEPILTTWGGVVLCADEGRRRVDNTLEARLRASRDELLVLIAAADANERNEP